MNDAPGGAEASHHFERHHSLEFVSLRDYLEQRLGDLRVYFERLLKDHADLHGKEAQVAQREASLVRTVLEQRMTDHDLRHDEQHRSDLRAVDQAREALESRLEKLNELRQEVTADRGQFITRGVFDAGKATADKERQELHDELATIREELARQRGRQAAYAVVGSVLLVVVPVLIQIALRIIGT